MKEKENYIFTSSEWEDALHLFVRDRSGVDFVGYLESTKEWIVRPDGYNRIEPAPQYVLEWVAANPDPKSMKANSSINYASALPPSKQPSRRKEARYENDRVRLLRSNKAG